MPASNQMPPLWPSLLLPRSGGGSELKVTFQQPETGAMEVAQKAGQQILDVLTSHIAVLDQEGVIVAVNKAWKTFGERNGGAADSIGVGVSYLAVCETSSVSGIPESSQAAAGIAQVLNGKLQHFQLEYACHSDTEFRWFRMDVTATGGSELTGAIVAHTNLTEHKAAEMDTKKLVHSLGERLDGLGVLYEVSRILADDSTDQAACLEAVASLLVRALRFPELGAARISYDGTVVSTKCFNASPWFIEKTFRTAVESGGKIELHYLEKPVGRGWGICAAGMFAA